MAGGHLDNLDGVFLSLRWAAPAIIASGGGSIVTIASVTGTTGSPLIASYAASKAAVVNLTKTAATELRDHGVRVNAVLPGFIGTDLVTDATPDFERCLGLEPGGFGPVVEAKQGRFGTPEDVARTVGFLADPEQSWITGSAVTLDGGALIPPSRVRGPVRNASTSALDSREYAEQVRPPGPPAVCGRSVSSRAPRATISDRTCDRRGWCGGWRGGRAGAAGRARRGGRAQASTAAPSQAHAVSASSTSSRRSVTAWPRALSAAVSRYLIEFLCMTIASAVAV